MTSFDASVKRIFDITLAIFGLALLSPVIIVAYIVASFDVKEHGLFIQRRVGQHGALFNLIKIKTMHSHTGIESTVTTANDLRVTRSGAFLRKTKIDELPQLWNVLRGDMSFVGPRPDVKGYADMLEGPDRIILSVRPGITGPASIVYKNEEQILALQEDPEEYNSKVIFPEKVKINKKYIENWSFWGDFYYLLKTFI